MPLAWSFVDTEKSDPSHAPLSVPPHGPPQPSGGSARWLGGGKLREPSPLRSVDLGAPTQAPPSPLPERAPSTRLLCDRRLLTEASLHIISSDYKIPMCPQWEIWKTHQMTERRTAAPVTAPGKSDLSWGPPPQTSPVSLVVEVSSTVSSGLSTEFSNSSAGFFTSWVPFLFPGYFFYCCASNEFY